MVQWSCRTRLFLDALNAINLPLIRRLHHMSSLGDAAMTEEALTKSTFDRVPFLQRVIPVRFVMDLCRNLDGGGGNGERSRKYGEDEGEGMKLSSDVDTYLRNVDIRND